MKTITIQIGNSDNKLTQQERNTLLKVRHITSKIQLRGLKE